MNYTDIEGVWRFARRGEVAPEGSMQTNMGWLIPVEPCIHGLIDSHRTPTVNLENSQWCDGARLGGEA